MLRTVDGKRLRASNLKSLAKVKAQFERAGHVPGNADSLQVDWDGVSFWTCECGAKLRFVRKGKTFNQLTVWELPFGER
jgi:hypothetical protein